MIIRSAPPHAGLLNTLYYTAAFLLFWTCVAKVPAGQGLAASVKAFAGVMAGVWAGSQVTKAPRAALALALAPLVDRVMCRLQNALGLRSKQAVSALLWPDDTGKGQEVQSLLGQPCPLAAGVRRGCRHMPWACSSPLWRCSAGLELMCRSRLKDRMLRGRPPVRRTWREQDCIAATSQLVTQHSLAGNAEAVAQLAKEDLAAKLTRLWQQLAEAATEKAAAAWGHFAAQRATGCHAHCSGCRSVFVCRRVAALLRHSAFY